MLLDVRQLLEASVTISTFVRLLACVHTNVLNQLMIAAEAFQTLLTLMGLYLTTHSTSWCWWSIALYVASVLHLHCTFMHENLWKEILQCNQTEGKFEVKINQYILPFKSLPFSMTFDLRSCKSFLEKI